MGAPYYFDRSKDHGGAVYVYMNENGSFRKEPSIVLKGPVSSAFGFALAAIGDVDQDGFQGLFQCVCLFICLGLLCFKCQEVCP